MKKLIIILIVGMGPLFVMAQQPKMHVKLYGGWNASSLVYRSEVLDADFLHGWQVGGGFRVMHRKAFLETDITYLKYGLTLEPHEDIDFDNESPLDIRIRALEFPLNLGYVAVKKPVFKWFFYGGIVNRFTLNGRYTYEGETESFRPKELKLHIYNLGARFGTQFDLAMFNVDFSYSIGITNAFDTRLRTNSHSLLLSVGLVL